jgi:dTDP-4-dehydrorhamnose reductase
MSQKIAVLGASGMLGKDLCALLRVVGYEVFALTRSDLDISDPGAVQTNPYLETADWVVNCAAYTKVDLAETEIEEALFTNALGPKLLAKRLSPHQRMIHLSTDFVFDGSSKVPYTENDPIGPLGVYGDSKFQGECGVREQKYDAIIFRTSWLFGPHGRSFPASIIDAFELGKHLRVVNDQVGNPTYTPDLAEAITQAIEQNLDGGVYHACGSETVSWHQFAELVLSKWSSPMPGPPIESIPSSEYPTPARRPFYSALSTAKLLEAGINPWRPLSESAEEFCARYRKIKLLTS